MHEHLPVVRSESVLLRDSSQWLEKRGNKEWVVIRQKIYVTAVHAAIVQCEVLVEGVVYLRCEVDSSRPGAVSEAS